MDKQDSLKTILNHLLDTAVYVIRQDSHGILYFNDRVKTVTPDIALGQVCHDVWEGSCELPVEDNGWKAEQYHPQL